MLGKYHHPPFHVVETDTGRIVAETWTAHRAFRVTVELDRQTLRPHHVRNIETGTTVRMSIADVPGPIGLDVTAIEVDR